MAYADFARRAPADLIRLGEAGIRGAVEDRSGEEVRDLSALLRDPPPPPLASLIAGNVTASNEEWTRPVIREVVAAARERLTPATLSARLHTTPATLARGLRRVGLPSPNRLIVWGRLLTAAWLLSTRSWTVERVALHLGYASDGTLRNQLRGYMGASTRSLRQGDGFRRVLDTFREVRRSNAHVMEAGP